MAVWSDIFVFCVVFPVFVAGVSHLSPLLVLN